MTSYDRFNLYYRSYSVKAVSIFPVFQTQMAIGLRWWWLELLLGGLLRCFSQLKEKVTYRMS